MTTAHREKVREKLNDIFCEVFDDDEIVISEDMTADDIEEWDSLMQVTLIVAIEGEFGIQLNASEIGQLANVGAMLTLLEKLPED